MANHEYRCTGRTTRRAVQTLRQCLDNPGRWIEAIDHNDLVDSHRTLAQLVSSLLDDLNVPHELDGAKLMVRPLKRKG